MLADSTALTNLQPEVLQRTPQPASGSEGEASETVFLIPGFGGITEVERGLQAACAPDLRLELVDLPDWPELAAQGVTSEGLIRQIADEIDSRAPEGELKIAGYSMGANLGLAVAQVLISQGRSIDFFGTIDGWAELRLLPQPCGSMPLRAARRLWRQLPQLLRASASGYNRCWHGSSPDGRLAAADHCSASSAVSAAGYPAAISRSIGICIYAERCLRNCYAAGSGPVDQTSWTSRWCCSALLTTIQPALTISAGANTSARCVWSMWTVVTRACCCPRTFLHCGKNSYTQFR